MTDELIERYLAGQASPEQCQQLRAALDADPQLVGRLYRIAERECELYELFAQGALVAAAAELEVRPTARLARRRHSRPWRWLPVAAAVLMAGCAWVLIDRLRGEAHAREAAQASTTLPGSLAQVPATSGTPSRTASTTHADAAPATKAMAERSPENGRGDDQGDLSRTRIPQEIADAPAGEAAAIATVPSPNQALAGAARTATPSHPAPSPLSIDSRDGEVYDDSGLSVMRYTLRAPHAPSSDARLGLALCFHGAGGDERWLADPMLEALRASGASGEFVVASLKSQGKNWEAADEPRVLAFIEWARHSYPIDTRRIVLQGVSNGGWFVNFFSSRHLDLVAGVVTLCNGGGFDLHKVPDAADTAPEFYVVHGTDDRDVNVKSSRAAVTSLRSLGYRFVYREYPGVAHNVFDDERTRRDFASWVERQRAKGAALAEDDRKALAAFTRSEDADRLIQTPAGAATLLRIGGVPAERVLVRCLHARAAPVRASAAGLLARTIFSPGVSALLAQSLDDRDDAVRQAALSSLLKVADWNDQEALVALCLFAGTRNHPRDDRLLVADRLVRSLSFRSSPGPDNQLVYELMIHLLEDEDQDLRTAGLSGLVNSPAKPATAFGYRPDAPLSARHEPVARWKSWYLALFAPPAPEKK